MPEGQAAQWMETIQRDIHSHATLNEKLYIHLLFHLLLLEICRKKFPLFEVKSEAEGCRASVL